MNFISLFLFRQDKARIRHIFSRSIRKRLFVGDMYVVTVNLSYVINLIFIVLDNSIFDANEKAAP